MVVYDESDSEPESVSESGWYGVYLEWFILLFMCEVLFRGYCVTSSTLFDFIRKARKNIYYN